MSKMSEQELKAIVAAEIADATAFAGGRLAEERRRALDYYLGEPFGNEQEGRSQVVSTDVADTVEWILPSLLRIFTGGDEVVRFEPTGPEDEEVARQATEYVNWIFQRDNPGKLNCTGTMTLQPGQAGTTVSDSRTTAGSFIGLAPLTANAAAEIAAGTLFVATRASGSFTLTHANSGLSDRSFAYVVIG